MSNKFSFPVDKSINKILDFFIFIGEHKYPIIKQVALDHCGLFQKLYNEASNSITIEYEDYHKEFQAIANLFCYSVLTFTSLNINYVIQAAEFFEIPELLEAAVAFKEEQDRLEVILSQPNELENLIQLKTAVFNINEANLQMAKENIANFVQSKYDIRIVAKLIYKACFARSSKIPIFIKLVSELEPIQHRFIKLVLRDFSEKNEVALPNEINFILFYLLENNVQKDFILQSISEKAQKMKFWVHLTNSEGHEDHIDLIRKGENPDSIPNAIRHDDCESLQQLIASLNFDINGRATSSIYEICSFINKKPTLIEYASFYGAVNCFKYLLLSGAKLPRYIFEIAVAGGNSEIIHLITQNENFFLSNNAAYNSILFHRLELFEWLLTNYPTAVKNYEVLAVKCIEESSFDIFQQFLREGTNPNGLPTAPIPLAAIKNDNLRLVDFLFRIEQVDVNITDRNGHTVLHLACLENKPDIVKFLLNIPRIEKNARNIFFEGFHRVFFNNFIMI